VKHWLLEYLRLRGISECGRWGHWRERTGRGTGGKEGVLRSDTFINDESRAA